MKKKSMRFGKGFRVMPGNKHSEAAEMVIAPGDGEGDPGNRHRGADQWLFVVAGTGAAIVNDERYPLRRNMLLLIERGDRHQILNTGRNLLRTLNIYVPPAYTKGGKTLPTGKR
jgi:mannose-6-phosphate isomerase-like protein (cupin superfamily)